MLRRFLADDYTVTKRQLGILLVGVGAVLILVGLVSLSGEGSRLLQVAGLLGGLASALIGLTLLPLGDVPA
ncbi:MAG: hypothetical protein ACUVSU_00930 [Aggregatilineaceae bacterium]